MSVLGKPERLTAMATPDPKSYADQWVHAWNRHDVEAVLDRVVPESGGVVRGKAALRDYWTTALRILPDLHFEVVGIYRGSTLVISRRQRCGARGPRHVSGVVSAPERRFGH